MASKLGDSKVSAALEEIIRIVCIYPLKYRRMHLRMSNVFSAGVRFSEPITGQDRSEDGGKACVRPLTKQSLHYLHCRKVEKISKWAI